MRRKLRATLAALVTIAALTSAAPAVTAAPVRGPDVSNNNGCGVNWGAVHAAGYRFGFAKANEGTGFVDRCFGRNYGELQHFGMVRGAYDFAHLGQNPVAEARTFLRTVRAAGGLARAIAVIDVEANSGGSIAHNRWWVQTWLDTVFAEGHPAKELVYTAPFFWNPHLGCWRPAGAGMWAATYGGSPSLSCGWGGWDFWQFTDGHYGPQPHYVPGIGNGDISVFSGDFPTLLAYTERVPLQPYAHRVLRPGVVGTDVRGLQGALNRQLALRRSKLIPVDGVYGRGTSRALRFSKYHLGFTGYAVRSRSCTGRCQLYVAHPNKRPRGYRVRGIAREHNWRYAHALG